MSLLSLPLVLLFVHSADAAPRVADLATTLTVPAATPVYSPGTYTVTVANSGTADAAGVSLVIQLPETQTSPTVALMGSLAATPSGCSRSANRLICNLGTVRKGRSSQVSFTMTLPQSSEPIEFQADATTTSRENNLGNNGDADAADLVYIDTPIAAPAGATVRHCTGQNLTAFYECSLFPSSISSHSVVLAADGSLSFPGQPSSYGGSWVQSSPDHLSMVYTDTGATVAQFEGDGVPGGCFEGLTTFPGSVWVSPYQICF